MTTFTDTWNAAFKATPAEDEDARLGAMRIRELKRALDERLVVDHSMAGTAEDGAHKKVTLLEQATNPGTVANTGYLYTKDVAGVTELFWYDSAGAIVQLTTAGVLKGPLKGNADTATTATIATDTASKTGTGSTYVTDTSPTLSAPALGTPVSGDLTNCTSNTEAVGNNTTQLATTAHCMAGFVNNDVGNIGVGLFIYLYNVSGVSIAAGATHAASGLNTMVVATSGLWSSVAAVGAGTWRNVTNYTIINENGGIFQRIA